MREPSLRTSRLAIAGGLVAAITVGALGFYLGRSTAPKPPEPAPAASASPAPSPSPTSEPQEMLDRSDLVALAHRASDTLASGETLPAELRQAVNRRFELAIPFGCTGPAGDNSPARLRWSYNEAEEALRLHVASIDWRPAEWGLGARENIEAIEGFWITRPWSSAETCPERVGQAMATGMEPVTLPGQTVAVAQFFTGDDRRGAQRDGRPFESVQRVPADEFDASRGFRLLLTGRIDRVPGGGPVRCIQPAGIEQRPICVVAVTFDEVRIENPLSNEVLATWPIGGD